MNDDDASQLWRVERWQARTREETHEVIRAEVGVQIPMIEYYLHAGVAMERGVQVHDMALSRTGLVALLVDHNGADETGDAKVELRDEYKLEIVTSSRFSAPHLLNAATVRSTKESEVCVCVCVVCLCVCCLFVCLPMLLFAVSTHSDAG